MIDAATGIEWEINPRIISCEELYDNIVVILQSINEKWYKLFLEAVYPHGVYDAYRPIMWKRVDNKLACRIQYEGDFAYARRMIFWYVEDTNKRYKDYNDKKQAI